MVKTKGQIISDGNSVCNGVLRNLDVRVTGHFGNVVSLSGICDVEGGGCVSPFGLYGTTSNIGYIFGLEVDRRGGSFLSALFRV